MPLSPVSCPQPLRILMSACVPRRREGGVAAIIYNLGRELEKRGHSLTYVFKEDLFGEGAVSARFNELVFARRLDRFISRDPGRFAIVNLHAPSGLVYGLRRPWVGIRRLPPYVMTPPRLEDSRLHPPSPQAEKGPFWHFNTLDRPPERRY